MNSNTLVSVTVDIILNNIVTHITLGIVVFPKLKNKWSLYI